VQRYFPFVTDDIVQAGVGLLGGGAHSVVGSCGTFSAALMVLSAKYSPRPDILSEKDFAQLAYANARFGQFRDWFVSEFGSVACRDVQLKVLGQTYNLMDDQEKQSFREYQQEQGKFCSQVAMKVALKVAEMLSRED